eukprot:FR740701.1.p2 GENE.FR740701.1~~FR740701.1.p2  ORF type:complete len:138 (-),score=13.12 FR740701.1:745-1158(-)
MSSAFLGIPHIFLLGVYYPRYLRGNIDNSRPVWGEGETVLPGTRKSQREGGFNEVRKEEKSPPFPKTLFPRRIGRFLYIEEATTGFSRRGRGAGWRDANLRRVASLIKPPRALHFMFSVGKLGGNCGGDTNFAPGNI